MITIGMIVTAVCLAAVMVWAARELMAPAGEPEQPGHGSSPDGCAGSLSECAHHA